jgi:hypothetical protein
VTEPSSELLAQTLVSTLEEAAFVFAERGSDPPPFAAPQLLEARIRYRGPSAGELRLVAEPGLAGTLAANLLGEDEGGDLAARAPDALGEILNMVIGRLVVQLFGESAPCRLGTPRVREVGAAEHAGLLAGAACSASLVEEEGRRIDLALEVLPREGQAP